jgi:predicted transport protein
MTLDDFFGEAQLARSLFDAVSREIALLGSVSIRVSKSQVAFRRKKNIAVVWMPSKYLKQPSAPLVLTLSFSKPDDSPRWKQITQVTPKRYTHHLELHQVEDINAQVRGWLHEAWEAAA